MLDSQESVTQICDFNVIIGNQRLHNRLKLELEVYFMSSSVQNLLSSLSKTVALLPNH